MKTRWSKPLCISCPELDSEHRDLYDALAGLQAALRSRATLEQIQSALPGLLHHVTAHFDHEERLMKASRYSGLAWHRRQHREAARSTLEFARRIRSGDRGAAAELLVYLAAWLPEHIGFSDRMMSAHLRNWSRIKALAS